MEHPVKRELKARIAWAKRRDGNAKAVQFEAFVLKHGQEFRPASRPKGMRKRKSGTCFASALLLAMESGFEYTYVEGFACTPDARGPITHHAWCVNDRLEVIDRVWERPAECSYFGVPFDARFVREQTHRTRMLESLIRPGKFGRHE